MRLAGGQSDEQLSPLPVWSTGTTRPFPVGLQEKREKERETDKKKTTPGFLSPQPEVKPLFFSFPVYSPPPPLPPLFIPPAGRCRQSVAPSLPRSLSRPRGGWRTLHTLSPPGRPDSQRGGLRVGWLGFCGMGVKVWRGYQVQPSEVRRFAHQIAAGCLLTHL